MKTKLNFGKIICLIIVFYISSPFIIFAIGWLRWFISVPLVVLACMAVWKMLRGNFIDNQILTLKKAHIGIILVMVVIVFLWVYLSGIGGMVYQNDDHGWRNAVYRAMVDQDWPIRLQLADGSTHSLIYYIGFWLPASVIGKIFGIKAGFYFQALWAVAGILLVIYLIFMIQKKIALWPVFALLFFSGLDFIGGYFVGADFSLFKHMEWWANPYQYSSMTTQLFWVFNQAIPAWLITLLIYVQKKNRYIVLILSFSLLTSTIPFIGMLPLIVYCIIRNFRTNKFTRKLALKDLFSYENIIGGGIVGITSFLYLAGNISGTNIASANQAISSNDYNATLMIYLLFIFFEVGIYFILTFKHQKFNPLFYVIIATLLLCPLIRIGFGSDFCMRASIPSLLMLLIFVIDTIQKSWQEKNYILLCALIAVLIVGAITPLHEIGRTINKTVIYQREGTNIWSKEPNQEKLISSPNFSGIIDNNFFYKYLAK